ncbi:MAG: SRPBCC family protein [Woeseia sp.]
MIGYIVIALILLVVLFAYVATRPDTFRVQRMTVIDATPEKIFPLINDFRKFTSWSPYEQLDPAMKRTFSGKVSGKGAVYKWDGNRKAGEGRMEIAHTSPPFAVVIRLDFVRPFETHNIVEFALDAEGRSTKVTWAMRGSNPYIAKLMQLFFSMDRLVGKDFERGLANLKSIVEEQTVQAVPQLASIA